jgi:hypothetical protein
MYKIKLSNGTELSNLELNGNNYISKVIIEDSIFENNLTVVTIYDTDAETETNCLDMKLVQNIIVDGSSWFILTKKTLEEKRTESVDKDIDDIIDIMATMLGV